MKARVVYVEREKANRMNEILEAEKEFIEIEKEREEMSARIRRQ